jgi:hypothetical protein
MPDPIQDVYVKWLCREVLGGTLGRPLYPYMNVCAYMHKITFKDDVPNDDNRSAEGVSLRDEFLSGMGRHLAPTLPWRRFLTMECTLLEMLVGMARRCNFQVDTLTVQEWFFKFLENLSIAKYEDTGFTPADRIRLSKRLNPFNNRTYSPSGAGSIFPLKRPHTDMRKLELWYQMSAYIVENRMIS